MFDLGDKLEVRIQKLAFQGTGIAKPENFTIFISRTAPGDLAEIEIRDRKKSFAHAVVTKLIEPSDKRITPPCPYFARCGGCHYQHIEPSVVQSEKIQQLIDTFHRLGSADVEVRPIYIGQNQWNYRNRVTYRRDVSGKQGYTAWDNYETLDIENCLIAEKELNEAWDFVRERISHVSSKVLPFVFLRQIGRSIAIIFSVTKDFSTQEMEKLFNLRPEHYFFYTTEIQNNSRAALGKEVTALFSAPKYLEEQLGELFYILQPDLFFQTNNEIAKKLVDDVVAELQISTDPVIDIYCGSGLFTIAVGKKNIPVLGVEVQHLAIQSAKQSAIRNNVESYVRFRTGKAEKMLEKLIHEGEKFSRAIVDPPRDGLDQSILSGLEKMGVKELYYISCSPPTLARDVKELIKLGYRVEYCQPYEMFPQTYHIETLTKLTL